MDANFTYPVILNATLIQPPQPLWKEWLPVIVSILVVILGYYVTITVERNKRQYELKKQIYFETLDVFSDLNRFTYEVMILGLSGDLDHILDEFLIKFEILKLKLEFCGAPEQITGNISTIMHETSGILDKEFEPENINRLIKETVKELKLDLKAKSGGRFGNK